MAKLVARFYDPTSGTVLVDGHDLRTVTMASLRSQMGIVPQEAFLFSGTVADNLAFGHEDASRETLEDAARAIGAWDFIAALPNGLDTEIGERGVQLSAGQRQLVAFARALVADPRILILDEATSNVDLHTEGTIEHGLRRLLGGRTAIVIAHRLSTIRQAGADRRARPRPHRRAGHARRADRGRRPLRRAVPRLGRARRRLSGCAARAARAVRVARMPSAAETVDRCPLFASLSAPRTRAQDRRRPARAPLRGGRRDDERGPGRRRVLPDRRGHGDGQRRRTRRGPATLGPGDYFGEMALITGRDAQRRDRRRHRRAVLGAVAVALQAARARASEVAWALLEVLARRVRETQVAAGDD